jgi:hypothetical protein
MTEITQSSSLACLERQRVRVASFMDEHSDVFAAPEHGGTWFDLVQRGKMAEGRDRHVADKALGMLVGVIRSAQVGLDVQGSIAQTFEQSGISDWGVTPDPNVLAQVADDDDPEEQLAYAQAVTLYKQMAQRGELDGTELPQLVDQSFAQLPGTTPLMRALIDTARALVQIDMEYVLAGLPADDMAAA